MPDNKCPKCGKLVPEGSKYCNHCGSVMDIPDMQCPECGTVIPGDSLECPKCHERIEQPLVKNPVYWEEQYGEEMEEGTSNHHIRNIVIVVIVVAFVALFVVNKCFYSHHTNMDENTALADTQSGKDQSLIDIFNRTLEKNNMKNDGDKIAFVLPVPSDSSSDSKLVGVTYLSDNSHSFYRIYELNRDGSDYTITEKVKQMLGNHTLIFDQAQLRTQEMPALVNVSGKRYFYFTYADIPNGVMADAPGAQGKITSVLYDVESGSIACKYEFVGALVSKGDDNMQQVKMTSAPKTSGLLDAKLVELAHNIGYLHMPTEAELEKAKAEKEEEENGKTNKSDSVRKEQEKKTEEINSGAEVEAESVQEFDKDNPQFRAEDFSRKIKGGGYTVFLLKDGRVFAYSQSSEKTFQVNTGEAASDIGWEDSSNGILNIRTSSGQMQYNLKSHTFKKAE